MSKPDFILSVLTDLASYADAHDLTAMKEAIKQAREVAKVEIYGSAGPTQPRSRKHLTLVYP